VVTHTFRSLYPRENSRWRPLVPDVVTKRTTCVPVGNRTPVVRPVATLSTDQAILNAKTCSIIQWKTCSFLSAILANIVTLSSEFKTGIGQTDERNAPWREIQKDKIWGKQKMYMKHWLGAWTSANKT
jgi:hypothetical protein